MTARTARSAPTPDSGSQSREARLDHEVVIVGSGFAGIGQAVALKAGGIDDFVILEKAADLGGTWRDNTYPGCACDIPSHLYSFSFELNPDWSRAYSPATEIWAYLRRCCTKYGIDPHLRVSSPLHAARYDEASATWTLTVGSRQASEHPGAASKHPGAASDHPGAASDHPGAASEHPGTASEHPGAASDHPGTASDHPGTASKHPGTASKHPGTASGLPGDDMTYEIRCRSLVLALGALHQPAQPQIEGLADFGGELLHTAAWDHSVSLRGMRVGIIGTGASAVQVVPSIVEDVASLTVFQRTPPWVLPRRDRELSAAARRRMARFPLLARLKRSRIFWENESRAIAFTTYPRLMSIVERYARRHLHRQVRDPELRAALAPDYTIGCKRILVTSDYYPALTREHVRLETARIERVDADAVVTRNGARHELDILVLATGFAVNAAYERVDITGVGGRSLAQEWATAPEAHLGLTVAGYPNLFTLLGPNTGLGHSSLIVMIEAQNRLVVRLLNERDRRRATSIAVRPEVQESFNARLRQRSLRSVWLTGCRSWYLDANRVNRAIWPGSTLAFRRRTRRLRPADYTFGDTNPSRSRR